MGPRALVYGDVDLNLIDGSAIWAQAMVQALARAGCDVTLVLKAPVRTGRLTDPLQALPSVTLRHPHKEKLVDAPDGMGWTQAVEVLTAIDAQDPYDLVVVRGRQVILGLTETPLAGRMWTYLTDVPQALSDLDPTLADGMVRRSRAESRRAELAQIANASRFLLCQTEELRSFLETAIPATCGKSVLFPPVVVLPEGSLPDSEAASREGRPLRLVYTGKFAPRWNTYEMTSLPGALAARSVEAELHMIGDKIHEVPDDPGYSRRMRTALTSMDGVIWHGGHGRAEAMRLSAGCDIGLSWRHPDMDASLELSTKVLELGALGLPVVLNRTPMHERLLGVDYPLFVGTTEELVEALAIAAAEPETYALAARRCQEAAVDFSLDAAVGRLSDYLARAFQSAPAALADRPRPLRVGVASHDLKFITRLLDHWRALPGLEVRVDEWPSLGAHNPEQSQELAEWADVVVCEWCGPNAVWYARHKQPGQRLIVRLHRFELYGGFPKQLDIDVVDQVICVSEHYAELTRNITGWPKEKVIVVPNWVDVDQLDRPKLAGAEYHLGMIGIAPSRKRLDLAVDVVEELRRHDPRFTLFVKSKLPWDYPWIWRRGEERSYYEALFRRIRRSPLLAGGVVFDSYGPDVASWLRRIGFVLSTSDDESFHLAPAEGMASGAVPALLGWPGAETIYDERWIHRTPEAIAEAILAMVAENRWEKERAVGRAQVRDAYGLGKVCAEWTDLLTAGPPVEVEAPPQEVVS